MEYKEYKLDELLPYEQPQAYIVESTEYSDAYKTPVLTAGKSFILGYTNETDGIFEELPVIIFDDFTTATQFVNFKFKVKSSAMKILHINTDLVLPKYIYYKLQTIHIDHSAHKQYWISQFSRIKVKVPSITEQQRIVSRIEELFSSLDNAVESLRKTKEQLAVYRQAVLKEAFEGKYITNDSSAYRIMRINDFADVGTGATPLTSNSAYYGGKIAWVASGKINDGRISTPTDYITDLAIQETNCKVFPAGTILVAMYGEGKTRGKCAELLIPAATNQAIAAITLKEASPVDKSFLEWFLTLNYHNIRRKASGGVQPNLNLEIIKAISIKVFSKLAQEETVNQIESRLSICDNIEQTVNTALAQVEAMRQSILKEAFEGRLV